MSDDSISSLKLEISELQKELAYTRDLLKCANNIKSQESDEKVRLILNSAAEAIYGIDQLGNCSFCNNSCLEMLGYKSENDLLGRNMHDLIHYKIKNGSQYPVEKSQIFDSFRSGVKVHLPNEILWKADGTSFIAEVWCHPIHKDDAVVGAVVTFIDTSRRKLLEDELHHQTVQLEEGLTERIMAQKALQDQTAVLEAEIEERRRAEQSLLQSETTVHNKLKALLEPEGDIGTLDLSDIIDCEMLQALMDDFYKITGILGAVLDISGNVLVSVGWQDICTKFHRCHPETLTNCIESDTVLSNGVPVGTFRKYRCKNNMWDMVTPLEVGGRHVGNIFIGQFFYDDEVIDTEMFRHQARLYGFDEKEYLEALDRVPRFSPEVVAVGMKFYAKLTKIISTLSFSSIKLSRIFSERIHLEEQLHQSQKMEAIGTMAGGIAHDFNNLLSIVGGNLELINFKKLAREPFDENLEQIREASARAKNLVAQILAFSRQEKHELVPVNLTTLVGESINFLRPMMPTTLEVTTETPEGSVLINADTTKLQQVLINLCANALHAMNDKGLLRINLEEGELTAQEIPLTFEPQACRYAKLSVIDTGKGMDKETLDRIFDPFFTTKDVGSGTGMGLSVVHGIIEQHGGFIHVDSTPSQGSTFTLYFPITRDVETTEETEAETNLPTGTENILFVDDEQSVASVCGSMLEYLGYKVTIMTNSVEALDLFKAHPDDFDLVITDQTMPKMSGVELAKELLKIKPNIPIILCSGYSAQVTDDDALKIGIHAFCMKPITIKQLATVARDALDTGAKSRNRKS